jgi:hypothetical protein
MDAVKEIKQQTADASELLFRCSIAWKDIHVSIFKTLIDTEGISTLLPTTELTEATKDRITGTLQTVLKSLQELRVEVSFPLQILLALDWLYSRQVAGTIKMVDDRYGAVGPRY